MTFRTLSELFHYNVEHRADSICSEMFGGEQVSYREFGRRAEKIQTMLVGAGLKPGDKVALLSSNMPNWSVCYLATVAAGMVIVPILPDFSSSELEMIIKHSEAKALMVSDKLFSKLPKETVSSLNIVIRTKNLGVIFQPVHEQGQTGTPAPEDLAVIIYTSGTTSKPKGVMLSHRNLCSQLDMCYGLFPLHDNDVMLSVLPLSHTYECSLGMLYPFREGARVVYLDRPPTASTLIPALQQVRPTAMLIVPLIIEKIYKNQVAARFNASPILRRLSGWSLSRRLLHRMAGKKLNRLFGGRLRFLGIGGARLDMQTEQFLIEAQIKYAIGYGLTETAPLIAGAIPGKVRLQSTGPVLEGIQVRLEGVNQDGEGEIVVKSPSTMIGYYKNPEATREALTEDGWFHTKDVGKLDPDGYLYIKSRLNSMIVGPSGENIYPEEIESVLNRHVLITDSLVTQQGGRLVARVRFNRDELEKRYNDLKDNWSIKMEEIKKEVMNYVNSKVSRFSHISSVEEEKEDFKKTPTHKIKRFLYNSDRKKRDK